MKGRVLIDSPHNHNKSYMAGHILSLNIPDVSNEGIFVIEDLSVYTSLLSIQCPELQILPPGYSVPSVVDGFLPGFRLVLNACTMGIMTAANCATSCPALPDGIWNIRYSVSPNAVVYVEYNYMRTTHAMIMLMELYCSVGMKPCLPDQETIYQVQQLDLIRDYLVTAKGLVEQENKPKDGMDLYRYAITLMNKLSSRRRGCRV